MIRASMHNRKLYNAKKSNRRYVKDVYIKDELGFIEYHRSLDIKPERDEKITLKSNQTLFTLLLSHQRSMRSNKGNLRLFPKPLLQSLCRPGGLFWRENIKEMRRIEGYRNAHNGRLPLRDDFISDSDASTEPSYNYCSIL